MPAATLAFTVSLVKWLALTHVTAFYRRVQCDRRRNCYLNFIVCSFVVVTYLNLYNV